MNFDMERKEKAEKIEAVIGTYLPKEEGYQKKVEEAMNYSVLAGGKRLRPMLLEETYKMFGGEGRVVEPLWLLSKWFIPILWCMMICRVWITTSTAEEGRRRM